MKFYIVSFNKDTFYKDRDRDDIANMTIILYKDHRNLGQLSKFLKRGRSPWILLAI